MVPTRYYFPSTGHPGGGESFPTQGLRCESRASEGQETSPHGFVDGVQAWLVVAGDEKLEGRIEVEKVLSHEARSNLVAAGQCLDLCFIPASPFLGLIDAVFAYGCMRETTRQILGCWKAA